jgi:O-antigen/teichoic acid export membrane protein
VKWLRELEFNFLYRLIRYTGFVSTLRLLIGLISQKVIAVFLGAPGLAIIANLRNLIEILTSFSSAGAQNGVIVETAANWNKKFYQSFINSTLTLMFVVSAIMFVILWWQIDWISSKLFFERSDESIVRALSFTIPFMGLVVFMEAVLSGKKLFKAVANLQLATNLFASITMIVLIYFYGLQGAIIAMVIRPMIGFGLYFSYFKSSTYNSSLLSHFSTELSQLKTLLPYILMTLISVGFVQAIEIWLRYIITEKIDINSAGYWTAINGVSSNYFLFISYAFTLYVLPKFAENNSSFSLFKEVKTILSTLLPIVTIAMIGIYIFRVPITKVLFTTDFVVIAPLFKWQLGADWVRVIFLVFAYYLVANKLLTKYFVVEFFSFTLFVWCSFYWVDLYGIEGVVMANFTRYIGCLSLIIILLINKRNNSYGSAMD